MKKNIIAATPLGLAAVVTLVLSLSFSMNAETLIGYGSVFALLAVAALEYRISWKRLLARG